MNTLLRELLADGAATEGAVGTAGQEEAALETVGTGCDVHLQLLHRRHFRAVVQDHEHVAARLRHWHRQLQVRL